MAVSLIIPTFNRPHFLGRLLSYYSDQCFGQPIIVADSSSSPARLANQELIDSLTGSLNVRHLLYPEDIYPGLKIKLALQEINSTYALFCADDDFIIPQSIEACVHFLEANPDYAIAHGRALICSHSIQEGLSARNYPQRTNNFEDPGLRLKNHLENYTCIFYSVHRRCDLIRNIELTLAHTSDVRFGELLPSCLSVIQGKSKQLNTLHMVRQYAPDSTAGKNSWLTLIQSDEFSQKYDQFFSCLAKELATNTGRPTCEVTEVVARAFLAYLTSGSFCNGLAHELAKCSGISILQAMDIINIKYIPKILGHSYDQDFPTAGLTSIPRKDSPARFDMVSIQNLLESRSPVYQEFRSVYRYLNNYPHGIATGVSLAYAN